MPPPGTCETVRFDFTTQAHNCRAGACPRPTVAGEINNRGVSKKSLKLDVIASQPAGWCGDRRECLWCDPPKRSKIPQF